MDQNLLDIIKENAETLRNTAQMLHNVAQSMVSAESDKDTAKKIVQIEGYLELVGHGKRDVNEARKAIAQELNMLDGIGDN
ncbi:MAG TPA: hypothetical protein PKY46_13795 [Ignavibacteriaceae bacterium]|nr:hypothetical protein [Ignavibacteriaceae bacterium]